jgi:hypothetical protein
MSVLFAECPRCGTQRDVLCETCGHDEFYVSLPYPTAKTEDIECSLCTEIMYSVYCHNCGIGINKKFFWYDDDENSRRSAEWVKRYRQRMDKIRKDRASSPEENTGCSTTLFLFFFFLCIYVFLDKIYNF